MAKGIKTGGRKEGTPNRDRKDLMERLNEQFPGYDPVMAMAEIANNPMADIRLKLQANKEVAKYLHPQLRSMEVKAEQDNQKIVIRVLRDGKETEKVIPGNQ